MNLSKKILLAILGEKRYLLLVARVFPVIYRMGLLGKEYQDIYFLRQFIREGDWCIDIGAHLGYFSLELSRLVKDQGKVFAIEPMSKFNRPLQQLLRSHGTRNVTVYPVALGGKGEYVEMGIPRVRDSKKFAYARVMESSPSLQYVESEKVKNESGDGLFKDLSRIDFIKCDVEGLEFSVFSSMPETLAKHRPVLLCEFFDAKERVKLYELLRPLGYQVFGIDKGKWYAIDVLKDHTMVSQNNYFISDKDYERFKPLFATS